MKNLETWDLFEGFPKKVGLDKRFVDMLKTQGIESSILVVNITTKGGAPQADWACKDALKKAGYREDEDWTEIDKPMNAKDLKEFLAWHKKEVFDRFEF